MFNSGDDGLIKKQKGFIYVLVYTLIFMIFAFGFIQFLPKSRTDQTCSYKIHPLLSNRFIRLNWPELPRKCK